MTGYTHGVKVTSSPAMNTPKICQNLESAFAPSLAPGLVLALVLVAGVAFAVAAGRTLPTIFTGTETSADSSMRHVSSVHACQVTFRVAVAPCCALAGARTTSASIVPSYDG